MMRNNFIEEWIDLQNRVFDYWLGSMTMNATNTAKNENPNIFEESMKPFQETIKHWVDNANDLYEQSISNFQDAYAQPEMINKMLSGANLYQNLNKLWKDLNLNITEEDSDPFKFKDKWADEYIKIVSSNFVSYLPEQLKNLFNECLEINSMASDNANKFYQPWLDEAPNLQNLFVKSVSGDQAAYIEFNKLWKDKFASTFGKILNIPQFSMNREQMQKQMHSFYAFVNFTNIINEFVATMVKLNQETFEQIIKDYQVMLIAGNNPKTFKEFYKYWWQQNEAAYLKLFATTEFSKLLAQVLEAGVNFKKEFDNSLEKQLQFLPYPSRNDMDGVYKTLDSLKREVRGLKKEVAALKEENPQNGATSKHTEN